MTKIRKNSDIDKKGGKGVVDSAKPKYRLDDLLAECDVSAPMPHELVVWERLEPVGLEDAVLATIVRDRSDQPTIEVNLDDL